MSKFELLNTFKHGVILVLTTDGTRLHMIYLVVAHFFTRWPLAASHDGRRMETDERGGLD